MHVKKNKNDILNSLMTKVLKILFDTKNIKISLLVYYENAKKIIIQIYLIIVRRLKIHGLY